MPPRGRGGSVGRLWWRAKGLATRARERVAPTQRAAPERIELEAVRRRLELMLFALHGRAVRIQTTTTPSPTLMDQVRRRFTPRHLRDAPVAWTDGDTVLLPPQLDHAHGDPAGIAHYRLLALSQAERIVRGTAQHLPALEATPLARDLFLLRESMAVEARLSRDVGGLSAPITAARQAALVARPPLSALTDTERRVETIVREALEPATAQQHLALADSTPADSLQWAQEMSASLTGRYHGVAAVSHWGGVTSAMPTTEQDAPAPEGNPYTPRSNVVEFEGKTADRNQAGHDSDVADPTSEGDAIDDARGALAPTDASEQVRHDSSATSARSTPDTPPTDSETNDPPAADDGAAPSDAPADVQYEEWAGLDQRYRRHAVTVRERVAEEADTTWAADTLRQNAVMLRRIREQFEPLRAERVRLNRQRDGAELDLPACIEAIVDARTGHTPSDRVYMSVRPARRAITICLLVDISDSTEAKLKSGQRIIDVERTAALFASEAFDVLGDAYAMFTFASRGARDVRLATLKDFHERNGASVRQRIAGIEPWGNTRFGAAVRHASARLSAQPPGPRLLLILSDGRPNDFDEYYEAAGVEDSRQAINEARALGIFPFCLTIDQQDGPEYLPRVFGPGGYTVLREPEQLPFALVRVVKQLLKR